VGSDSNMPKKTKKNRLKCLISSAPAFKVLGTSREV
jgi:hypothetical protein